MGLHATGLTSCILYRWYATYDGTKVFKALSFFNGVLDLFEPKQKICNTASTRFRNDKTKCNGKDLFDVKILPKEPSDN